MANPGRKHAVKAAIGAAAVGVATSVTAVAVTTPASISTSLVDLAALIVVGSSTNPSGAGVEDFFGGRFNRPMYTGDGGVVRVNFGEGAAGIQRALEGSPDDRNVVLSSGWGAANASLLLLAQNPVLRDNTIFVLDNDVARPDGGFGTRYPWFSLIGVNPIPTPSDVPDGVTVINTGYEYDYNSNAPGYVLNPFSAVNSLAAYLNTRLNQSEIDLPVDDNGQPVDCGANTCAVTEYDGVIPCPDARCSSPSRITAYVTKRNDTTYVTYTTRELPLTTLIRSVFGNYIADVSAPLLKWAVDFGYYGGNPIPSDPSAYRPARFIPSIGDILTALVKLPGAIIQTLAAIVSPFLPRQAAPARTTTTQLQPEEQETGQETPDPTENLSTVGETEERSGQDAEKLTSQETTAQQLTRQEQTPQELNIEDPITDDPNAEEPTQQPTSTPLMNVQRNSLRALPGQPFVKPGDGNTATTTGPESVDTEQNSEPQELTGPAPVADDAPDATPNPGDDGEDSPAGEAEAAA